MYVSLASLCLGKAEMNKRGTLRSPNYARGMRTTSDLGSSIPLVQRHVKEGKQ